MSQNCNSDKYIFRLLCINYILVKYRTGIGTNINTWETPPLHQYNRSVAIHIQISALQTGHDRDLNMEKKIV